MGCCYRLVVNRSFQFFVKTVLAVTFILTLAGLGVTFYTDYKSLSYPKYLYEMIGGLDYRSVTIALHVFDYLFLITIPFLAFYFAGALVSEEGSIFSSLLIPEIIGCFIYGPHLALWVWSTARMDYCKYQRIQFSTIDSIRSNYPQLDIYQAMRYLKTNNVSEFLEESKQFFDEDLQGCPGNELRWVGFGLLIPFWAFFAVIPLIVDVIVIVVAVLALVGNSDNR